MSRQDGLQDRGADVRAKSPSILRETLQEARVALSRPGFWLLHGGGMVLAALAGPFHTMQNLNLPGRVVYWSIVVFFIAVVMTVVSIAARAINRDRLHWVPVNILASLSAAPLCLGFVWAMNTYFIGLPPDMPGLPLISYVAVPLVFINLMVNGSTETERRELARRRAFERQFGAQFETETRDEPLAAAPPPPTAVPQPATPPNVVPLPIIEPLPGDPAIPATPLLFEKLPEELGRDLICLQAQDHYVEATTTRGTAQVLMRLSDAERDLTGFDGLRVHRSWWVNLDHVTDMARTENGGTELTTTNGMVIPVSRGQKAALREALDERRKAAE